MDKGIYTALSGSIAKSHEIELIANNLANANTPGFKRDVGTFSEYVMELRRPDTVETLQREITAQTMFDGRPPGDKSFVEMDGIYTSHSQGTVRRTGRSLDMAMNGTGYFEVLTPAGVRYTRQGNFSRSAEGQLVTANGFAVLSKGEAGAAEQRVIHLGDGPIQIDGHGGLHQNGAKIADIAIQEFKAPQWLSKVGNAYFRNEHPDNARPYEGKTEVLQGFLESSNVNPVREMTKLIQATRAYGTHMQAIKAFQQIDAKSANEIARNY